jgi:hypothetical protein
VAGAVAVTAVSTLATALAALALGATTVGATGQVAALRASAHAAADLAALAAAQSLATGTTVAVACARAGVVASGVSPRDGASGPVLRACTSPQGSEATVVVGRTGRVLGVPVTLEGRARAGPASTAGTVSGTVSGR